MSVTYETSVLNGYDAQSWDNGVKSRLGARAHVREMSR